MEPDAMRARTRLLLIRHGQTPWNAAGRWQGHADPGLDETGRAQALALAQSLAAAADRPWSKIVSSDLRRALETAQCVAKHLELEIETDVRLRELDVGRWSGSTRAEIAARDPERLRIFESGDPLVRPGDGESRLALRERAHAFVRDLVRRDPGEDILVVTHRGIVRALCPEKDPTNAEAVLAIAEDIVARGVDQGVDPGVEQGVEQGVDRSRRADDGVL